MTDRMQKVEEFADLYDGTPIGDAFAGARAEIERLRAALKTFADRATEIENIVPVQLGDAANTSVRVGELRRARAAYYGEEGGE